MDFLQSYRVITAQQSHSRNGDFCPCCLMSEHILPMFIPPCLCFLLSSSLISISWKYFQQTLCENSFKGDSGPVWTFFNQGRTKKGRKEAGGLIENAAPGLDGAKLSMFSHHLVMSSGDLWVICLVCVCVCRKPAARHIWPASSIRTDGADGETMVKPLDFELGEKKRLNDTSETPAF